MATQTFEELLAVANKIKDNELPESNTHNLVGDQLLQMTNKMQEESSNTTKAFSDLETDRVKKTTELNISVLYPTLGINGTNKYTLAGAIIQVTTEYRNAGIKVTFLNESNDTETWEYAGVSWVVGNFSEVGSKKITEQDKEIQATKESFSIYEYDYTTFWPNGEADKVTNEKYLNDLKEAIYISFSVKTFWSEESVVFALYDENKTNIPEHNLKVKDLTLNANGCRTGLIERPSNAKYVAVWAYQDTDYRQFEYIKLLNYDVIKRLYLDSIDFKDNYAKNEVVENIDKQVGIASGSYQSISRCDVLEDIWRKGFKINTSGQEEANSSYFVTDFIDVT